MHSGDGTQASAVQADTRGSTGQRPRMDGPLEEQSSAEGLESEAGEIGLRPTGHGKDPQVEGPAGPRECWEAPPLLHPGPVRRAGLTGLEGRWRGEVSSPRCNMPRAPAQRLFLCSWWSRAGNNVENLRPGLWNGRGSIYKWRGAEQ